MVSNFDRIFQEIRRESERVAAEHAVQPGELTELVMEMVDVEDQHSLSPTTVNKKFKTLIQNFAGRLESNEGPEAGIATDGDGGGGQGLDR